VSLTLLLGGARSGKSRLAVEMMADVAGQVALIATAEALDDEMKLRIDRHRETRPDSWEVVEEPLDMSGALGSIASDTPVIVDCLTLWVSNLMGAGRDDAAIQQIATAGADAAAARAGSTVVVSNEVGSGIVPINEMARRYRDILGSVNSIWAARSDRVLLAIAGGVIPVQRASEVLGGAGDG
jgi:adenosyl cobinamide kinase/adenosyl cobinamide phosphate guanylyltransferase